MKKIALILGSTNENGNTSGLASQLAGQLSPEVMLTKFNLQDYQIKPFENSGQYDDDFRRLFIELLEFDVIILASPVYWYAPSGQMKMFMDRISDYLNHDKDLGRRLRTKSAAVLATGYGEELPSCFEDIFARTYAYLGMEYLGLVYQSCQSEQYQPCQPSLLQDLVASLSAVYQPADLVV